MSASEIMPYHGTSTFDLFALRFQFEAQEPVEFPRGTTADLFRGQIGKILYRSDRALYDRVFAPVRQSGASGLRTPPRPFVLRVRHLDGAALKNFSVGMNAFERDHEALSCAMKELGRETFRAELAGIDGLEMLRLPLAGTRPANRVRVHFLSPTELKNADRPQFGALFSRIRDRISTLRALYGSGPLEIDFESMGSEARDVRMTRCDIQFVEAATDRRPQGGFIGAAEYEGDLTAFLPYLEIAAHTGVGRQTVWGKGEIRIETF